MAAPEGQASSGYVDNWQAEKTLAQCNLRMLDTEDSCDVTVRCGSNRQVIKAHRYMLISRSYVFHAMFSGPLAETSDISVPDIEASFFKQLLIYLYTDDVTIDADNATALLYAARKYAVTGLENKCRKFLEKHLTVENACVILEAAHRLDEMELNEKALTLIKREGERSLQSLGFLELSQDLVDQIIESDDLQAEEHVVFTAVNNWAESECDRQGREVTPEAKRSVLGETLLKVRFPLMKLQFMVENVKVSDLLTQMEDLMIHEYIISSTSSIHPFNNNVRRQKPHTSEQTISRRRFNEILFSELSAGWSVGKDVDAISFKSNKNIIISGYQLYSQYQNTGNVQYRVTSYFGSDITVLDTAILKDIVYIAEGEVFDVIFPHPVSVTAGEWCTLAVLMVGPKTWSGTGGISHVVCDDEVEFDFKNSTKSINCTCVEEGQIPSLIYSLA